MDTSKPAAEQMEPGLPAPADDEDDDLPPPPPPAEDEFPAPPPLEADLPPPVAEDLDSSGEVKSSYVALVSPAGFVSPTRDETDANRRSFANRLTDIFPRVKFPGLKGET